MDLDKIRPVHIQNYINQAVMKYAPETIKKDYNILNLVFQTAIDNQLCAKGPVTKNIKLPKYETRAKKQAYTQEQYNTVYDSFYSPEGNPYQPNNWANRVYRPFIKALHQENPEIPELSPHELRHTRATLWIAQGIEPYMGGQAAGAQRPQDADQNLRPHQRGYAAECTLTGQRRSIWLQKIGRVALLRKCPLLFCPVPACRRWGRDKAKNEKVSYFCRTRPI